MLSIFSVIGAKTLFELLFYLWSIPLYRRWTGDRKSSSMGMAMLAAVAEPFTFQLLRHFGAALGWVQFMRGGRVWGKQPIARDWWRRPTGSEKTAAPGSGIRKRLKAM